jgi:uroporphyrinogen-III decarboxylase
MVKALSAMTSRERVFAAVKGLPVDRVPVMYWFNPHAACRLMAEFFPAPGRIWNLVGKRAWKIFAKGSRLLNEEQRNALPLIIQIYANAEYPLALGADIADLPFGTASFWGKLDLKNGKVRARDAFGSLRGMGGIYMEVIEPAIKTIEDLKNFKLPDVSGSEHYDRIRKFRKDNPGACIIADNFGVQDLPHTQLWEMSKMMMALYDYPEEVKAFQSQFADWNIEVARKSLQAGADMVFLYDDYGYNNKTLISMKMWKEFTYPHLKRQIEAAHEAGGLVMLHSCGYQMPFLPYYVEAGLDILQTFQPKAGNDFSAAYAQFGDKLAFATGIDVQLGESMTAGELRESIIRSYRTGGHNGRHILGMTHMLQYTMPAENIRAILETVRDIQAGKLDG